MKKGFLKAVDAQAKANQKEADEIAALEYKDGQRENAEWSKEQAAKRAQAKRDQAGDLKAGREWLNKHLIEPARDAKKDRDEAAHDAKVRADNIHREAAETGVGDLLRRQFEAVVKGGGDLDASKAEMQRELTTRFGEREARRLVGEAGDDAKRSAMHDAIFGQTGKASHSQTIGSVDFARQIQAGVSNDNPAARQLAELVKIRRGSIRSPARSRSATRRVNPSPASAKEGGDDGPEATQGECSAAKPYHAGNGPPGRHPGRDLSPPAGPRRLSDGPQALGWPSADRQRADPSPAAQPGGRRGVPGLGGQRPEPGAVWMTARLHANGTVRFRQRTLEAIKGIPRAELWTPDGVDCRPLAERTPLPIWGETDAYDSLDPDLDD